MTKLLEVESLDMHFPITGGVLRRRVGAVYAVSGVTFTLDEGETLGIVGESGCGKTTLGRAIVRLYEPTAGTIRFRGHEISHLSTEELKQLHREMQMVFQDPYGSLNPRMSVQRCLEEPLAIHGMGSSEERRSKVRELVELVGLRTDDLHKFPHEFSGGQRQRIGIARALVLEPRLVVADEPVSALDVSVQSQVINLMRELQERLSLTYIFISHDLTVVKYIADRIGVMYLGHLVELAASGQLYERPAHPYTRALLSAVPRLEPQRAGGERERLEGDLPSPKNPPPGCVFHTRCRFAQDVCRVEVPELRPFDGDPSHLVACHLAEEID